MDDAKELWGWWQSLLAEFKPLFTHGGWVHFVHWVTGMVLCPEEHTITQILTGMDLQSRWRTLEHFAEYGAWNRNGVERQLIRLIGQEQPGRLGKYRVACVDDTKEHRNSKKVWGVCSFHEYTARSPNRAETVRAHNWVVMGGLIPGEPWTYLPQAARLYLRKNQLPEGESFQTKTAMAVDMLRANAQESDGPLLAVFDGAYAMTTVIRPCLQSSEGQPRIECVTRLRKDARLYAAVKPSRRNPKGGRPRQWGKRLPAPQHHEKWDVPWKKGTAYLYGRERAFRYKRLECYWSVSGPSEPVVAYVFEVEGYKEPWFVVTSASDLSGEQVAEAKAGRFRHEDGFRDHKQRLGMEECRAWTKEPVLRTFQVQLIAQALLRLIQFRLDREKGESGWWKAPEWNPRKKHASILDMRRLFWRHRERFSQLLIGLHELKKPPQTKYVTGRPAIRAA